VPEEVVIKQVELFVRQGYEEIVLTGIHLGKWGEDLSPRKKLVDLLKSIEGLLSSFKKPFHLRLSSLEVKEIDKEFIEFLSSSQFIVPHFHIPLQSGSNRILKLMGRDYTKEEYLATLEKLYSLFPDATFGADVMVGFPTETEEDFEETYNTISASPLNWLHIFTFSPRPGTKAWDMKPKVSPEEAKSRYQTLKSLFIKKRKAFLKTQKGKIVSAVLEKPEGSNWKALSENYITLNVKDLPKDQKLKGKLTKVKLSEITEGLSLISFPV
jgi:threonylcarbamoyladenosine tRNA methylthiotransferase MtaB